MKKFIFKNPVKINCHLHGLYLSEGETEPKEIGSTGWTSVKVDAVLFEQIYFPGHQFYVAKFSDGYRLVEYSTGVTIGGNYADKTADKAAAWFDVRIEQYTSVKIIKSIHDTLQRLGRANGEEKQFTVSHPAESEKVYIYTDLLTAGADAAEIFDLDTVPIGSDYYLQNGFTAKRII
jgi:hypothetical protein